MPDFFIDYDYADVKWADWIAYQLEKAEYTVFHPEWDIRPGMNKVLSINEVLQRDELRIILVLSPNYLQKSFVVWPTRLHQDRHRDRLLPIKIRQCPVPSLLSDIESIDLIGLDGEEARIKLLDGVVLRRKRPTTPPKFPGSTNKLSGTRKPYRDPSNLPRNLTVPERNSFFTDHDPALARLYETFKKGHEGRILTHVINGLGGVGKTQVAIEYVYRYQHLYDAVLWIDVSDRQKFKERLLLFADEMAIQIPQSRALTVLKSAVKQWLQTSGARWLLILDNIKEFAWIKDFLPSWGNGHILMTMRAVVIGKIAASWQYLSEMKVEDGALLLLRRIGKFSSQVLPQDIANPDLIKQAQELSYLVGNLPLMLDQAGAYIKNYNKELSEYLEYYKNSGLRPELLKDRGPNADYPNRVDHLDPVATTWDSDFAKIHKANSHAYALLLLCSFLHHKAIPEEVITKGVVRLPIFQKLAHNPLLREKTHDELHKYSFLVKESQTKTFSIHPLVQVVLRDSLSEEEQQQWAERAIIAVYAGLHSASNAALPPSHHCLRYFCQVERCLEAIKTWSIVSKESTDLLSMMSTHLHNYISSTDTGSALELDVTTISDALKAYQEHLQNIPHITLEEKMPEIPETNKRDLNSDLVKKENTSLQNKQATLTEQLAKCRPGQQDWRKYEDICIAVLNEAFTPPLRPVIPQARTESGLERRDALLPLLGAKEGWENISRMYDASCLVCEFKNYARPIHKNEVIQVATYLKRAIGRLGIIFSRKSPSLSALNMRRSIYAEDGKLILFFEDKDLIELLKLKEAHQNPLLHIENAILDFIQSYE